MTKTEWQKHHGFDDEDMLNIELLVNLFNGKITKINVAISKLIC